MTHTHDGQKAPENVRDLAIRSLDADKATDIEMIDLRGQTSLADYLIIASGTSSRHIGALAQKVTERLKALGLNDIHVEGMNSSEWVVVDAGDVIIHIFKPEVRTFYNIEKMWSTPRASLEGVTA